MPELQPMPLADYTSRIFQAAGTPKYTADLVGQSLVSANLAVMTHTVLFASCSICGR